MRSVRGLRGALLAMAVSATACGADLFSVRTEPAVDGVEAAVSAVARDGIWDVTVTATNRTAAAAQVKVVLSAEPRLVADSFLVPGVNYNGNDFGADMPKGWERDGEPWVFGYDRCAIPSCTISENADEVFALFASDADPASHVSSCSLEKLADGSFRHLVYWPVTEAPLTYDDKRKFSARYDTYLTIPAGGSFTARAHACRGRPPWPHYGFAAVFPVAWKVLKHETPAVRSVREVMRLDKAFMDWCRRKDGDDCGYYGFVADQTIALGNAWPQSPKNLTIADIERHPEKNWWMGDAVARAKKLKPGEIMRGRGSDIGFSAQSFQFARLSIEYGLRNGSERDVAFGLDVFRSWFKYRLADSGFFKRLPAPERKTTDASNVGWSLGELSRTAMLLRKYGRDAATFERHAEKLAKAVVAAARADGNLGSQWSIADGTVTAWGGDSGGYVLMGLARYWQLTHDPSVRDAIDRAFAYYFGHDIDRFACTGGAMDCASVDREGIHPFITAAVALYGETKDARYLDWARRASWYFLSWLYCHNPVYGPETDFAKFGFRPAGTTIVGAEHPGIDDYGCVLVADFIALSKFAGEPLWRDVAAFMWRNATQCFADEDHRVWHALERPVGAKNEAYFECRWSKYRTGERKRGHFGDFLTAWGGAYRTSSVYDLAPEDLAWLERACAPVAVPVWLEAERFVNRGGWRVDTQFVHKMGSACLLAVSNGKPVADARTRMNFSASGKWRAWVRTRDWLPEFSPGRFRIAVGEGAEAQTSRELGASGKEGWRWEDAGVFEIAEGRHLIRAIDTNGGFARFDAILFSPDLGFVPPDGADELAALRARLTWKSPTPADGGAYDVVVVGAGPAGMGAAIAAARTGAKTLLVHDRPVLGGNASKEIGVTILGAARGNPNARETGLVEELKLSRLARGFKNNSEAFAALAKAEKNLAVVGNTRIVKVKPGAVKGMLESVEGLGTLTGERTTFRGKVFVDCTGDGWIGYYAGVPWRFGRESRDEFGEEEAPERADKTTMSGVIFDNGFQSFEIADCGHEVKYETPAWARVLPPDFRRPLKPTVGEKGGFRPVWWLEHEGELDDFRDPERARDELVRISFAYFGWGKNDWEHRDLLKNHELRRVAFIDGRRETLRLVGAYTMTGNDQKSARPFDDAIAYGGWGMDTHDPLGVKNPDGDGFWTKHPPLPVYPIPFRILYNPDFGNLLFAGRCLSATHLALGSLRVESTLMTLGQVCGTAAALCARDALTPKALGDTRIRDLQQRLLKDDLYIPGLRNEDPDDLARRASVTATSSASVIDFRETDAMRWMRWKYKGSVGHLNLQDKSRKGWLYAQGASPSAAVDGVSRIVGDDAHAWVSDPVRPLPQALVLTWPTPQRLSEVRLTFDSDLMGDAPTPPMPPSLVRDYAVEAFVGGAWRTLADVKDNGRRQAVHRFESVSAERLRVTCKATWGGPSARIFEIRAY